LTLFIDVNQEICQKQRLDITLSWIDRIYRHVYFHIWIWNNTICTLVNQLCCHTKGVTVAAHTSKFLISYILYIISSVEPSERSRKYLTVRLTIRYLTETLSPPRPCVLKDVPVRFNYTRWGFIWWLKFCCKAKNWNGKSTFACSNVYARVFLR
jgi:hypothetical protein